MKNLKFRKIHLACIFALAGILILTVCHWYAGSYSAGFEEIFITLTSPLKGSDTTAIEKGFAECAPKVILWFAVFAAFPVLWYKSGIGVKIRKQLCGKNSSIDRIFDNVCLSLGIILVLCGVLYVNSHFSISDFILLKTQQSDIYEDYYVDSEDIDISLAGEGKNVILLYLESMETSYASIEDGGSQDTNYIPQLTQLAQQEVNFSDDGLLGGFYSTAGSSWTAGALFSTTSAVPYPVGKPVEKSEISFAPNVTSLYDILDENGYSQYYLCGSDAYFGGRSLYYQSHGDLTIYDHSTAIADGYIDEDYHVWWGYEDAKLYDIAKDKITAAADSGEPFSFTMLTADTHFPQGFMCQNCGDSYGSVAENVICCADCQAAEFISWCKEQDFYKDTVIVVLGDHPRMDKVLPRQPDNSQRTVYACFVNCSNKNADDKNRLYTQLDIMPTVLSAAGFEIQGNRIALGTNLFSDEKTLAEIMGYDALNTELCKNSKFMQQLFSAR